MESEKLKTALLQAGNTSRFFIATADDHRWPHLAVAGGIKVNPEGLIEVSYWFCPQTLENIVENKRISIVGWDAARDRGFQLLGEVQDMEAEGMMDGYDPHLNQEKMIPQSYWRLKVKVDQIFEFKYGWHTDAAI